MMRGALRILLIEDNVNDAELIERKLRKSNGFELEMLRVDSMRGGRETTASVALLG